MSHVNADLFYAALEDQFRGSCEKIRIQQQDYLLYVWRTLRDFPDNCLVLDIGCGRGEWLSLLREHGCVATGIDINSVFVERCRKQGLEVCCSDAITYLENLEPESHGFITAYHVVEHLAPQERLDMLALAWRALRPGGRMILETPNPHCLPVSTVNFYFDPTHSQPIPPATLAFSLRYLNFEVEDTLYLAPIPGGSLLPGWQAEQDYAVISRRRPVS